MASRLRISPDLTLPDSAITEVLAFLGRRGSGKTYAATLLAEQMLLRGAQIVCLDAVGVWYGLRLASDGKGAGFAIPIFGGLHGDLAITPESGGLVADAIVDHHLSAIVDTSQFEHDAEKNRFTADFAARFFFRKKAAPSAVHLFLEESQEYAPQNTQRGEERMLHAIQRLVRLGRNFGIGDSLISQRPQDINKKVLSQAEIVFAFQLVAPHELKAVAEWCAAKGFGEDLKTLLPGLPTGKCHIWSPSLLRISTELEISEKSTFAAGTTPKMGAEIVRTKPLEAETLAALQTKMSASIEEAEANDPSKLRQKLRALAAANQALEKRLADKILPVAVDIEAIRKEMEGKASSRICETMARYGDLLEARLRDLEGDLHDSISQAVLFFRREALQIITENRELTHVTVTAPDPQPPRKQPASDRDQTAHKPASPNRKPPALDLGLKPVNQRVLNALAELTEYGLIEPQRSLVALFSGYGHPRSTGFVKALGALRSGGLIDYPNDGAVALTPQGRVQDTRVADDYERTSERFQARIKEQLPPVNQKMLDVLIRHYPAAISREDLAVNCDYGHPRSTGFVKALGRLRGIGLIDYGPNGRVRACDVLFPEANG